MVWFVDWFTSNANDLWFYANQEKKWQKWEKYKTVKGWNDQQPLRTNYIGYNKEFYLYPPFAEKGNAVHLLHVLNTNEDM